MVRSTFSFSISMSSISATRVEAVDGIEDFEQFLLFFDGELQIGADGVGQLAGIVHADGRDHGLVVQVLAELDVLLEQGGDALHRGVELRIGLGSLTGHANRNLHEPSSR